MLTSLRVSHLAAAFCVLALLTYGANLLVTVAPSYRDIFLLAIAGSLCCLMLSSLRRQERVMTELRAHQDQLGAQSAFLQSILENMGEGVSVFDRHGKLLAWNSQFKRFLMLPLDLNKASLFDIMLGQITRGDFGPVANPEQAARERCEEFYKNLPAVIERPARKGHVLQIRRREMPGGSVVSLYADVTEQKAVIERMEQARIQAEVANRAKSDFLANMSHELRTPLNAIIGFSEVISSEILGPVSDKRQLEYIKDIHSSGLLLLSIINDVLDMSKIEAGKLELVSERVVMQDVIAEAVRMVSERARVRSINLVKTSPNSEVAITGDGRALKQVVLNLLSNAVKFSNEAGQVDIRTRLDPAGGMILEVEDYGIGMSEPEMQRAMQPFGQAKPATIRTHGGTGLGLPIAKGLAEAHGGTLTLESSPGRGTLVRITLPLQGAVSPRIETMLQSVLNSPGHAGTPA
ncbi:MAG: PAS-domain containing protein [Alphaproteobacteria bacterium]|nr:PAS-domain containing protein [Alphaproteobacteria bacterium]